MATHRALNACSLATASGEIVSLINRRLSRHGELNNALSGGGGTHGRAIGIAAIGEAIGEVIGKIGWWPLLVKLDALSREPPAMAGNDRSVGELRSRTS